MRAIRPLLAILSVFAVLALAAGDADARIGGGKSSGSRGFRTQQAPAITNTAPRQASPFERTMTQPGQRTAPTAGAPAAQQGGFFNRPGMGLLGGLAAGFLGAGLLGMLFGGGFLSGLGSFASILGLIAQIALVVIVARLAWAWWQRRQGGGASRMAYAHANMQGGQPRESARPNFTGGALGSMLGAGATGAAYGNNGGTTPGNEGVEITPADYDAFEDLLMESQAAYSREDLAALRRIATPEMLTYFADDLNENAAQGVRNEVSDVKLLQGDLAEAWREDNTDYATVAMRFSIVDKMIDRDSGRVVDGGDEPTEVTELWTFVRGQGGRWMLSAIQQS